MNRALYPAKLPLQPKSTIFSQSKASDHGAEGEGSDSFKSLAGEFSVAVKTSAVIDANLADIVKSLLSEKVAKASCLRCKTSIADLKTAPI